MAIALVQSQVNTGTNTAPTATFSGGTVAGNTVIAKLSWVAAGGTATLAGYTTDASLLTGANFVAILSNPNVAGSVTTLTAALSGSSVRWIMAIEEWSGLLTAASLDRTASATTPAAGSGGTGATLATTQSIEMIAAAIGVNDGTNGDGEFSAPTNGFTLLANKTNGNPMGLATLYKSVAASGPQSTAVTCSTNPTFYGVLATYKATVTARAYTSQRSGNWSLVSSNASSPWYDAGTQTGWAAAPGGGDTAVVATGHAVAVDVSTVLGTKGSSGGIGVTINATNAGTFGSVQVNGGVTLTLRGNDLSTNAMAKINAFALFQPLTGSTVEGDVNADYASGILNLGRFEPQAGATFTIPAATQATLWNTFLGTQAAKPTGPLDYASNLRAHSFPNPQIANGPTSGTQIGTAGNFPVGVSAGGSQGFYGFAGWSTNPNTEVAVTFPATTAQVAAVVNAAGKYAIDYDAGIAYFYGPQSGILSVSYNYYYLNKATAGWRGWGVVSYGAQAGCTCLVDGCNFNYMGAVSGTSHTVTAGSFTPQVSAPVVLWGHNTGAANTNAYVKNSTFRACIAYAQVLKCTGSAGTPLPVSGNTFWDCAGNSITDGVNFFNFASSYITIDSNQFSTRGVFVNANNIGTNLTAQGVADFVGLRVTNNTGFGGNGLIQTGGTPFPGLNQPDAAARAGRGMQDTYVGGNTMWGASGGGANGVLDGRAVIVSGTAGHPAVVENNDVSYLSRLGAMNGPYVTFRNNRLGTCGHHGVTGLLTDDTYVTDINFYDNLFWHDRGGTATNSTSAAVQGGYNHRGIINNLVISNNTFDGWYLGAFDYGDSVDQGAGVTLLTNLVVGNNIICNGNYAFSNYVTDTCPVQVHALEVDYNNVNGQTGAYATSLNNNTNATGFYQGANKYNRLTTGNRNIPSVALWSASYTTAQAGRALVYTVNTLGQDHTLAWGGGAAVQLVSNYGTAAGAGFRTVPCVGNANLAYPLTGSVTWSLGGAAVTGVGTAFTTELAAGDLVRSPGHNFVYKVLSVADDTHATLTTVTLDAAASVTAIRHRVDFRHNWLWVVSGTGAGQARPITWASPYVCYAATVHAGSAGTGYASGDYVQTSGGTSDTLQGNCVLKVTSVTGGAVNTLAVVSGGSFVVPPTSNVSTLAIISGGSSLKVDLSFAPGYILAPDLATAVDATSVFAVVNSMVKLTDSGTGTVNAGIGMCEPGVSCHLGTVTLPTTTQTDSNITVTVNRTQTGVPAWASAANPSSTAANYKLTASSAGKFTGTADNAAAADYFGVSFASPPSMGFAEFVSAGRVRRVGFGGGFGDYGGGFVG